ncbi:MAG: UDP-N-acetylmuramoyl-L-alanine--D-glutamate ligase [Polyangiaceae bacterium]|nr:UDP-N-acetylmuramoyl-L-alanine--D-glutamate ligase [Polyangiaceae bacterium]
MGLEGRHVVVVGLGRSGVAAARLARALGATVTATDSAPLEALSSGARALDAVVVAGGHAGVPFTSADLVVVSPGVPRLSELAAAEAAGVEVIGELELALRSVSAPIAAIGGTNGKSTVTTLVGAMAQAEWSRAFVGGNLGVPLAEAALEPWDAIVLEVSSFQLERAPSLRPRVAVLLNVTDDHLDRYASFEDYARAKGNAFVGQLPADAAVIPVGDPIVEAQARRGRARWVRFGAGGDYDLDAAGRQVCERATGTRFDLRGVALHGRHNLENAAAAIAAARELGVGVPAVEAGLRAFRPLPHRMELVGEVAGVRYYDDSKGTNVGAAVTALAGLEEPRAVLIAGGRDKLGSYEPLARVLRERGRAVVVLGEAADRIADAVEGVVPVERAHDLETAVRAATARALPGDAVLLSPACSSFDMFKSYAERGERFAAAVRGLAGAHPGAPA